MGASLVDGGTQLDVRAGINNNEVQLAKNPNYAQNPSISATPDFVNYAAPTLPGVVTLVVSATLSTHGVLSPPTVGNVGFLSRGTSRG